MKKNASHIFLLILWPLLYATQSARSTASYSLEVVTALQLIPANPDAGELVTASFVIKNTGSQTAVLTRLGVGARGPGCTQGDWNCAQYQDFPFLEQVSIEPGQTYTYTQQRSFAAAGSFFARISYEYPAGAWYFLGDMLNFDVSPGLQVSSDLALTPANPRSDQLVKVTFTLHNAGASAVTLQKLGVGARGPGCAPGNWSCASNVDFAYRDGVTIQPSASFAYEDWRLFNAEGSYFAQISALDSLGVWQHLGSQRAFTVSAAPLVPRSTPLRIGANFTTRNNPEEDAYQLSLAKSTGMQILRIGASWKNLEPDSKGSWNSYEVNALKSLVQQARALNMRVFLLFLQTPCWASSDPAKDCDAASRNWDDAYPPANTSDAADSLGYLVDLLGPQVDAWEIWNEPNLERFWKPAPDAAAYTQLLRAAYQAVKARDPGYVVLGGSLAGADLPYLNAMYQSGAGGYFDGLALHPYSTPGPADCTDARWSFVCGINGAHGMMLLWQDDSPIWLTEFGWSTYAGEGGVSEEIQRQYLQQSIDILGNLEFVQVASWYTFTDTRYPDPKPITENDMGLYTWEYRPKLAAEWLRKRAYPFDIALPLILK